MMKATLIAVALFACGAFAKKGGKGGHKMDTSDVLNPDPDALVMPSTQAEYNPELTEGDIATKDGKKNSEDRNAVADVNQLWPRGTVPYVMDGSVSSHMKEKIDLAMADYNKYTCIRWVPRKNEKDYVFINSQKQGCYAYRGRTGGQQPLNLQDPGCDWKGTVIHEMAHTLGFAHEQSRGDRDDNIRIHWNNIEKSAHSQFDKLESWDEDQQGFGYDFSSVMHYGSDAFAKRPGALVMETKDKKNQDKIGNRAGFSKQDVEEINKLYKCRGKCPRCTSQIDTHDGCSNPAGHHQCDKIFKQHGKSRACSASGNIPEMCAAACGLC